MTLAQVSYDDTILQFADKTNDVIDEVNTITSPEAYIPVTFQNSWVDFGSGVATCAYYKDESGVVRIKGTCKDGTAGAAIFTLPVGYRPLGTLYFTGIVASAFGIADVRADGVVLIEGAVNTAVTLDAISFRAEQ